MSKRTWNSLFTVVATLVLVPFSQAQELVRDPTTPLGYHGSAKSKKSKVLLQAIFKRHGDETKAIINGVLLSKGESVEGWTLREIHPNRVLLHSGSDARTLYLRNSVTN